MVMFEDEMLDTLKIQKIDEFIYLTAAENNEESILKFTPATARAIAAALIKAADEAEQSS